MSPMQLITHLGWFILMLIPLPATGVVLRQPPDSASAEDPATNDYEAACELMDAAYRLPDPEQRLEVFSRAAYKIEKFIQDNAEHPKYAPAYLQLGTIDLERARTKQIQVQRATDLLRRKALIDECRRNLSTAEKTLLRAGQEYEKLLKRSFPTFLDARRHPEQFEQREAMRMEIIRANLLSARCVHEAARTHEPGNREAKAQLERAAECYEAVFKRFGYYMPGLEARLSQGQCLEELNKHDDALKLYEEVLIRKSDHPDIDNVRAMAMHLVMSNYLYPTRRNYDEAIRLGEAFIQGREKSISQAMLDVRWVLAKALLAKSKLAATQDEKDRFSAAAQVHAEVVARNVGRFNNEARFLMEALSGKAIAKP